MAGAPRRPLVAGNWKMNGLSGSETELARIIQGARELAALVELMVCPPATLLANLVYSLWRARGGSANRLAGLGKRRGGIWLARRAARSSRATGR